MDFSGARGAKAPTQRQHLYLEDLQCRHHLSDQDVLTLAEVNHYDDITRALMHQLLGLLETANAAKIESELVAAQERMQRAS